MQTPVRAAWLFREIQEGGVKREDLTEEDLKNAARPDPVFTPENIQAAWQIREIMQQQNLTFAEAAKVWSSTKAKSDRDKA